MVEVSETWRFVNWLSTLTDPIARQKIVTRLRRLTLGNPGNVRSVGEGVSEMRIDWGPGYRVYFISRGRELVIILGGGTKRSQRRDIQEATLLARGSR